MGNLEGWVTAIGTAACRFFVRNNHENLFGAMCSDGASAAGWNLVILALLMAVAALLLYGLFRPR